MTQKEQRDKINEVDAKRRAELKKLRASFPDVWQCYQDDADGYHDYKKCDLRKNEDKRWYCKICRHCVGPLKDLESRTVAIGEHRESQIKDQQKFFKEMAEKDTL